MNNIHFSVSTHYPSEKSPSFPGFSAFQAAETVWLNFAIYERFVGIKGGDWILQYQVLVNLYSVFIYASSRFKKFRKRYCFLFCTDLALIMHLIVLRDEPNIWCVCVYVCVYVYIYIIGKYILITNVQFL